MQRLEILLDADMPRSAAAEFRSRGHDVQDVRDLGMGPMTDSQIVEYALRTGRVIVTRDTDFGEVLRYPWHPGAVILRLPHTYHATDVCAHLGRFLDSAKVEEIRGAISILELGRVRRRPTG